MLEHIDSYKVYLHTSLSHNLLDDGAEGATADRRSIAKGILENVIVKIE